MKVHSISRTKYQLLRECLTSFQPSLTASTRLLLSVPVAQWTQKLGERDRILPDILLRPWGSSQRIHYRLEQEEVIPRPPGQNFVRPRLIYQPVIRVAREIRTVSHSKLSDGYYKISRSQPTELIRLRVWPQISRYYQVAVSEVRFDLPLARVIRLYHRIGLYQRVEAERRVVVRSLRDRIGLYSRQQVSPMRSIKVRTISKSRYGAFPIYRLSTGWPPLFLTTVYFQSRRRYPVYSYARGWGWTPAQEINYETAMAIRIQPLKLYKNIAVFIQPATPEPQVIYPSESIEDLAAHYFPGEPDLTGYLRAELFDAKIFSKIRDDSLSPVPLPSLSLTASDIERSQAILDFQWQNPHYLIHVLQSSSQNPDQWILVTEFPVVNIAGTRYREDSINKALTTNNTQIKLGKGGRLAIQLVDDGYGLPDIYDYISVRATVEEVVTFTQDHLNLYI
ncbi:MAG: hypothetical protein F6K63_29770 [Moorea sp. SIO1G6]|uniref:hypothetical protein n=1 Tax=Moorena sp. SIO1G6 TaxID=2607840 RepID=UPI0013C1395B|nr:hypothetical protein [Moorena sp. SIO1G6]NET68358.1 hypothetical protein [Moorena sp. SIO1G6]